MLLRTLGVLLLLTGSAQAHGEYAWIGESNLRDPINGQHCCGPIDCEQIPEPKPTDDGYFIPSTGETIPYKRLLPTQDGKWWRCRYLAGEKKGQTRCLIGLGGGV